VSLCRKAINEDILRGFRELVTTQIDLKIEKKTRKKSQRGGGIHKMLLGDIKKCENCEAFGCVNRVFCLRFVYEPTLDDHDVSSAPALGIEYGYGFCPRRRRR
jgi:hypothetical protein